MQRINTDAIPNALKSHRRWVAWKYETRKGKVTKPPYQTTLPLIYADNTKPGTWGAFDDAIQLYEDDMVEGIGFQLGNGFFGIDLDRHIIDSELTSFAKDILARFETYSEYSPSGEGIHIIGYGTKPGPNCSAYQETNPDGSQQKIEIYDSTRYFTVTGNAVFLKEEGNVIRGIGIMPCQDALAALYNQLFPPTPETPSFGTKKATPPQRRLSERRRQPAPSATETISDVNLLSKIRLSRQSEKFEGLWRGNISGYPSPSEADVAFCDILAFWTRDVAQIDSLFRQSGLYREKWDEKHGKQTYGQMTIDAALKFVGTTYQPSHQRTQPARPAVETKEMPSSFRKTAMEKEPVPPKKAHKGLIFPESAWRGVFEVYRRAVEGINEAPIAYSFAALKTIAGIIMGRTAHIYVGRRLYPNFFSCLVGPTGISRKSTAADLSIEEILANADPNVIYLAGLATSEGLISKLEVPSATADAEENDAPKLSLFMQARVDATSAYEGFRVIVSLAEYAALLKKAKKSSSDGLIQTLTAAYDCPIVLENPTRHAPQKAMKPCTAILALSTQEWMEESLDVADIRGGFANRFCYYLYEQTKPNPHPTEPNTKDMGMVIQHLHQTRAFFQGKHIKFEFDPETKNFVDDWYNDIWYQAVNESQELVREAIQRLDSNARKLALLYAMLENGEDDRQIHIEQFKAAVDVAIYWKETALSIFSTFAPNIQAKNERRIMDKLAEKPRTRRQLQQAIGGGSMSAKDFNDALDELYKAQRVETVDGIYMLT